MYRLYTTSPSTLLGHSPSRMHTLRRRTAPHLALARNSLSSGVTTSTRNMATQQSLPSARSCSRRGWWRGMNKAPDISSPVKKRCGPASRPAVKYPVLQIQTFSDHSSRGAPCVSRLVQSVCERTTGVGGGTSLKQLGQYHVYTVREPDHLAPKFSSHWLTVDGWALACDTPTTHRPPPPTHYMKRRWPANLKTSSEPPAALVRRTDTSTHFKLWQVWKHQNVLLLIT